MTDKKDDVFQVDIDEKTIKVNPMLDGMIRGKVREGEKFINEYDGIIPNGNPDIDDIHDVIMGVLPEMVTTLSTAAEFSKAIDFNAMAADFVQKDYVKDKALAVKLITNFASFAEKAGQVTEKLAPILLVQVQQAADSVVDACERK